MGPLFNQDRLQISVPLSPLPAVSKSAVGRRIQVANLLLKGAVEEIQPERPGVFSRIFLVPKKNGKLRLIIDLSSPNYNVFV